MSTTTTTPSTAKPASSSLAASAKFKSFAIVFALSAPILYVLCDLFSLPLFTYHPATNRVDLGWAPGRSGEGPAMYWYGWTATVLIGSTAIGWLATLLPEKAVNKIPLALLWLIPLLAIIPLFISLKPFWEKGGWW